MRIKDLELWNFRNYATTHIEFGGEITLLMGDNASGKTNVVEAIFLTSYGRVLRGKDSDAIRWGSTEARVAAQFEMDAGVRRQVRVELRSGQKSISVDGKILQRRSELIGSLPVVVSWVEDMSIAQGEPQARRRFVDGLVSLMEPAYLDTLRDYHRSLRQRNRVLAEWPGARSSSERSAALQAWTERLADLGAKMVEKRRSYLEELEIPFAQAYGALLGEEVACVLEYVSGVPSEGGDPKKALLEAFERRRREEIERGQTLVGPHLDDLSIRVGDVEVRRFGSRGEAKSVVLALRLAVAQLLRRRRGETPVVVIDDVFSDLDDGRAGRVLAALEGFQGILTSAEVGRSLQIASRYSGEISLLAVENGRVRSWEAV